MPDSLYFKNKGEAFSWYVDSGGTRGKSSFYQLIPTVDGKKVSKYAVSEMLRSEKQKADESYGSQRSEELAALELEEKREKVQKIKLENRREGAKWIKRVDADMRLAALTGYIYDTIRHHIQLDSKTVCFSLGVDPDRAPELETAMENLLDRGFNEISQQRLVEMKYQIEETEEGQDEE